MWFAIWIFTGSHFTIVSQSYLARGLFWNRLLACAELPEWGVDHTRIVIPSEARNLSFNNRTLQLRDPSRCSGWPFGSGCWV